MSIILVDNVSDTLKLETVKEVGSKEKIVNEFARITQYITWPFFLLFFNSFLDVRIKGREKFKKIKGPFIIISNHVAYYDSFLFRLILGPITPHLPLRFMAATKFERKTINFLSSIGVIDFIYSLFGVFTVVPGLGIEKNIEKAKEIIKIGGNVVIFPEGRVSKNGQIGPFKKGAAALKKATGAIVIPISFKLGKCNILRKRININVGEEIVVLVDESIEDTTEKFHKVISELQERE